MEMNVISHLSRTMPTFPSRRDVLRSLAGAGLGLGFSRFADDAVAKKRKRKHKSKKRKQKAAVPNAYGCIDVGDLCQTGAQCCSGICEGKKGKQTCRAHDEGSCTAGTTLEMCGGADVACTTAAGAPGFCMTTTGNAGYCGTTGLCAFCKTDLDCQLGLGGVLGPRAACVACSGCPSTGETACATRETGGASNSALD